MQIQRTGHAGDIVLSLSGRLDAENARHLEGELDETIRLGARRIVLDFSAVSFMSSAGIRTLIKFAKELRRLGGAFSIRNIPPMVREVLALTGLLKDFEGGHGAAMADGAVTRRIGPLECMVNPVRAAPPMRLRFLGAADDWMRATAPAARLDIAPATAAFGVGMLGTEADASRAGEFVALGGSVAAQPGSARTADYLVGEGGFVPSVTTFTAVVADGVFTHSLRFSADDTAPLSALAGAAMELCNAPTVMLAFAAETRGLVGVSLRRADARAEEDFFAHPAVRDRLAFTADPAHDRRLALAVGLVTREVSAPFAPRVRALPNELLAHVHAAVFHFQALPAGPIEADETARALFGAQEPLSVLHLLTDDRSVNGIGESRFSRGVLWAAAAELTA